MKIITSKGAIASDSDLSIPTECLGPLKNKLLLYTRLVRSGGFNRPHWYICSSFEVPSYFGKEKGGFVLFRSMMCCPLAGLLMTRHCRTLM